MEVIGEVISSFKNIKDRPFLRKAVVLISGTAIGQVIPIITAPFVTRIYSPPGLWPIWNISFAFQRYRGGNNDAN